MLKEMYNYTPPMRLGAVATSLDKISRMSLAFGLQSLPVKFKLKVRACVTR